LNFYRNLIWLRCSVILARLCENCIPSWTSIRFIFYQYYLCAFLFIHLINSSIDYKQKISMIQFIADLLWEVHAQSAENQMETDQIDKNESNLIIKSTSELFQIVQDLNLFNPIDDQTNSNLFMNWSKEFLKKTFSCTFE